ncbi:hypothetical protein [Actinosynnema sp. NPDC020468]|uniref:hypothetical protein n=1 Tax=Actinosynnema sp. NPDC020468 TaxID=3154488 RepID=UPI0033EB9DD6
MRLRGGDDEPRASEVEPATERRRTGRHRREILEDLESVDEPLVRRERLGSPGMPTIALVVALFVTLTGLLTTTALGIDGTALNLALGVISTSLVGVGRYRGGESRRF